MSRQLRVRTLRQISKVLAQLLLILFNVRAKVKLKSSKVKIVLTLKSLAICAELLLQQNHRRLIWLIFNVQFS